MPGDPVSLLAVLAHPDDESLGCGGVLADTAARGLRTGVLTATPGQGGRYHGIRPGAEGHPGAEALARVRKAELRRAADALGVSELIQLDYADGALAATPTRAIVGRIASEIRRLRPRVVITFAPDGAYGHPDHIAISQFTMAAVVEAARPEAGGLPGHTVSKLYHMAWTRTLWDAYEAAVGRLAVTVDGVRREAMPWPDWAVTTEVDTAACWPTVWKAVSCHASQVAAYRGLADLPPDGHAAVWGRQQFYRAFSRVDCPPGVERDLFAGLAHATGEAA